jgi:hypothetical protein
MKELKKMLQQERKKMLKHELERIWITSDDRKFLHIDDALKHEETLEKKRAITQKEEEKVTELNKLFLKVLNSNNWGLYFKGEPITLIPTNDDNMVYKVNEVKFDRLIEEIQKELENNCQENTQGKPTGNWSSNG